MTNLAELQQKLSRGRAVLLRRLRRRARRAEVEVRADRAPGEGRGGLRALHRRRARGDGRRSAPTRTSASGIPDLDAHHRAALGPALRGRARRPALPRRALQPRLARRAEAPARGRRRARLHGEHGHRARGLRAAAGRTASGVPCVAEDARNAPTRGYDLETTILADAFLEPMVELHQRARLGRLLLRPRGRRRPVRVRLRLHRRARDGRPDADLPADGQARRAHARLLRDVHAQAVRSTRSAPARTSTSASPTSRPARTSSTAERAAPTPADGRRLRASSPTSSPAGVLAPRRARSRAVRLPDRQLLQAAACPRGLMNEISWAPVYRGLRAQQPHADVPAADEPALPGGAHRRQRGELLPRRGAHARRRARGHPARSSTRATPVNVDTYDVSEEELEARGVAPAAAHARRGDRRASSRRRARARDVRRASSTTRYAKYKRAEWEDYNTSSASGSASSTCISGRRAEMRR